MGYPSNHPIRETKATRGKKGKRRRYGNVKYGMDVGAELKYKRLALKAHAKANLALSQLNSETKYVDRIAQSPVTTRTGSFTLLNPLVRGTAQEERIGDQVRFKSIDIRAKISNAQTGERWLRMIVIKDNQPNGATPTMGNFFIDTGNPIISFRNLDYGKRFKVYYDQTFAFQAHDPAAAGYVAEPTTEAIHIDLKACRQYGSTNNVTEYGLGNAGTVADIAKGAYYLLCIGNNATNGVQVIFSSRMKYIDN